MVRHWVFCIRNESGILTVLHTVLVCRPVCRILILNAHSLNVMNIYNQWFKKPAIWAYTAAILLHLMLLFFGQDLQRVLFAREPIVTPLQPEPVRFEFVDVQDAPSSEVPETPLASHQNQMSRDAQVAPLPEQAVPYFDGVAQNKESFSASSLPQQAESIPTRPADPNETTKQNPTEEGFDFADILKKDPKQVQQAQERAVFGTLGAPKEAVPHQNANTRALERGGLQLSTYAWNYAPYMAYLKRQIDRHIFPPRAFDLGLIDGTTRLKFRIYRDGRLEGPELLEFKGSEMLKNTSLKAVELSAPFKGLPEDFPEEFLEIVGTFEFIVLRGHQQ